MMSTSPGRRLQPNGSNFTSKLHSDTYPFIKPPRRCLQGKHVLITGASKGIGRALATSYARAGASVLVLAARSDLSATKAALIAACTNGRPVPAVITLRLDVADGAAVASAAQQIARSIGHLDIVVSNAGVLEPLTPLLDSDPETWWRTWETNVRGTYHVLRAFVPLLLAAPAGGLRTVVAVASVGAHLVMPGASAYQPGKLALLRLMEFVSTETDGEVLAYAVHPGAVLTEMGEGMGEQYRGFMRDQPRLAGDAVVFLSRVRREWLAGRYVSCTWDMEELLAKREEIEAGDLLKVRMAVEKL